MNGFLSATHPAAERLVRHVEDQLRIALEKHGNGEDPHTLARRATVRICDGWEHYALDGKTILSVGPIQGETEISWSGVRFEFSREVRHFGKDGDKS